MNRTRTVFAAAVVADGALVLWGMRHLPQIVPIHWNIHGEVDRYGAKAALLLLIPIPLLLLWVIAEALRFVDPKVVGKLREPELTPEERIGAGTTVMAFAAVLLVAVHAVIVLHAARAITDSRRAIALLLSAFFVAVGNLITRVRPNYFVGIRTPWTLSSDTVWRKTHRTGGYLMVLGGLLVAACAVLPHGAFVPVLVVAILVMAVIPVVQSYILWKREQHDRA